MKIASAIVTNRGGRTCHAAIIARELGVPAVVGCGDATEVLKDGTLVTVWYELLAGSPFAQLRQARWRLS